MDAHEVVQDHDEGIWDELSNQHDREMEEHHARFAEQSAIRAHYRRRQGGGMPSRNILQTTMNRAGQEFGQVVSVFREAATEAWREAQQKQQYDSVRQPSGDAYLGEFGIPTEDSAASSNNDRYDMEYTPLTENEQQPGGNEFVFLENFGLRPRREGWGAAGNLDLYFQHLYMYYYAGGLVPIVCKGVVELVTLFFTLLLSVFLFAAVDWKALSTCTDETTCQANFSSYVNLTRQWQGMSTTTAFVWTWVLILYTVLFAAYSVFAVWNYSNTIRQALQAKWVFEERLGISAQKLQGGVVDWDADVVTKLLEMQQAGTYRIVINDYGPQGLDALIISNRIMRKENFLIALFNSGLLDLTVPCVDSTFFCASLEWSLHFCILNFMFNRKYQIRPAFYLDPQSLKRRFILCGAVQALFMPFVLFFMILHFSFQNAYDLKSTQNLGPKEWSLVAKWTFREFNELPHDFERRLAPSYRAAEHYLDLFGQNEIFAAAGRILVFVGGSIGAVLFVFAAMNDAILLHVKIAQWNLLWFAGVAGIVFSIGKVMVPDNAVANAPNYQENRNKDGGPRRYAGRNMFAEMDAALAEIAAHSHHFPENWKGRGWDPATYKSVKSMFQNKVVQFGHTMLAVILSPYILCVSLPPCAEAICNFVLSVKATIPGAGDVCGYATFDFEKFGDENWEGKTLGRNSVSRTTEMLSESILQTGNVEESIQRFPKPKARQGKMEKSFFRFKAVHPNWKCSLSGQHLLDKVEQYRCKEETAALTREQQLHMEAAARQLEIFSALEKERKRQRQNQEHKEVLGASNATPLRGGGTYPTTNGMEDTKVQQDAAGNVAGVVSKPSRDGADVLPPCPTSAVPPNAVPSSSTSANVPPHSLVTSPIQKSHIATTVDGSPSSQPPPPFGTAHDSPPDFAHRSSLALSAVSLPLTAASNRSIMLANTAAVGELSSELRNVLNMASSTEPHLSNLDPIAGSLAFGDNEHHHSGSLDSSRVVERQYLWLERYHAHVAAQHGHPTENTPSRLD